MVAFFGLVLAPRLLRTLFPTPGVSSYPGQPTLILTLVELVVPRPKSQIIPSRRRVLMSIFVVLSRPTSVVTNLKSLVPKAKIFASFSTTHTMSHEFLVQIPDFPNSLDKRLASRSKHLANLKPHIDAGKVVFGGATLAAQPKDGEAPDMTGSVMLMKADSQEEVMKFLENDEYVKGGAWDIANAKITPFRCAVRTAL